MSDFSCFTDIPVELLDDLVRLGEIELGRGNIISKIDIRNDMGSFPIYSSSSKNNGKMGAYGKFMFDEEMVTWSVDGGGKFFHRPQHKFSVTNVSGYMRANRNNFDYKFLHGVLDYQHLFLNFDYQSKAHPSVIRELYKIPIPPLPEQKKIASILTSVDEVIENTQKEIDKLQDLKKATMNDLLTKGIGHTEFKDSELGRIPKSWEISSVGEVVQKIEGGGTPSRANPLFWGKEIPWATVKDLKAVRLTKTEESITSTGLSNSSSRMIPQGTVIIATRMAVGKTVIFDKEVSINQDLKALFPTKYLDSEYLLQWFLHNSEVIAALGTGSTVKGVRLEVLKGIDFLLPPLSEQKKIASIFSSMEQQVDVENQKLAQTRFLKKSLMQDLLTGKVRVQVN